MLSINARCQQQELMLDRPLILHPCASAHVGTWVPMVHSFERFGTLAFYLHQRIQLLITLSLTLELLQTEDYRRFNWALDQLQEVSIDVYSQIQSRLCSQCNILPVSEEKHLAFYCTQINYITVENKTDYLKAFMLILFDL